MTAATDTKIELLTEAIEALVLASVVAATSVTTARKEAHQNVLDARAALKAAIALTLAPSLRVIEGDKKHEVPALRVVGRNDIGSILNPPKNLA